MKKLYDLFNEETRTDTVVIRGVAFVAHLLVIAAALKYLVKF